MKKLLMCVAGLMMACGAMAVPETRVHDLTVEGEIAGENIIFTINTRMETMRPKTVFSLVTGDVAYLAGTFPRGVEVEQCDRSYVLQVSRKGMHEIGFDFASRAATDGEWRETKFRIPVSNIRQISVLCDRPDLEIEFPGALRSERSEAADGRLRVTAFLGLSPDITVRWKPKVRRLDADLVVACSGNTIASAGVGALRLDSVFSYRVIQGGLEALELRVPGVSVTQVRGEDIQEWRLEDAGAQTQRLLVKLTRPRTGLYELRIESEMVLPKFPCEFNLPVLEPLNVMRASGFLLLGTDSATKLQIDQAGGLTQIDRGAFPTVAIKQGNGHARTIPLRSVYAYQYASVPYTLSVSAADVVPSITADNRLTLQMAAQELVLNASVELTVRDAPIREILFEIDPDPEWTVTSVSGKQISEADVDIRSENGKRILYVPFREAVDDAVLVDVRMEKSLGAAGDSFSVPRFIVRGARDQRGYLVVAAEQGVRLKLGKVEGLQQVNTGSAPMRVEGAQHAFRYRSGEWQLSMLMERKESSIHSELFHLYSLGEGVMYVSSAITYHISGAPVKSFSLHIPKYIDTVEFTGADIESWQREDETCTVELRQRVMGDYTLLVTYDRQFDYEGAVLPVAGIETVDTDSEVGYVALASSASIKFSESEPLADSIFVIDRHEIPAAYAAPVTDPVLRAYKYTRRPHAVMIRVEPYATETLLDQVVDYLDMTTRISRDGETVTTATYYIKNTTRQYLVARLPVGADLWSIVSVAADGTTTEVPSQQSEQGILVPVSRPQDPNTPLTIRLEYALGLGKLHLWGTGIRGLAMQAPTLDGTHASFMRWSVNVPQGWSVNRCDGTSIVVDSSSRSGERSWLRLLIGAGADGWGGRTLRNAFELMRRQGNTVALTRAVNLSDREPVGISLRIVPSWIGPRGSVALMGFGLASGFVLLGVAFVAKGNPPLLALGATLLCGGMWAFEAGRSVLVVLLAAVVVWVAGRWFVKAVWVLCRFVGRLLRHLLRVVVHVIKRAARLALRVVTVIATACAVGACRVREAMQHRHVDDESDLDDLPLGPPVDAPSEPLNDLPSPSGYPGGSGMLGVVFALCLWGIAGSAQAWWAGPRWLDLPVTNAPVMEMLTVHVDAPGTDRDEALTATVSCEMIFECEAPVRFVVAPGAVVLTDVNLNARNMRLSTDPLGHVITVLRAGRHSIALKWQQVIIEDKGIRRIQLPLLPNLQNSVTMNVPEVDLDVQSGAVLFRRKEVEKATRVDAVFGPVPCAVFTWRPRLRSRQEEKPVFSTVVDSIASLRPGVVEVTHRVTYQMAQGELRELSLQMPEGMSVTAVDVPDLATWRFDPQTRQLDAIMSRPASIDFVVRIVTQHSCQGLPYSVTLGVPVVSGAVRQRGAVALAAPDTIQLRADDVMGVYPMNIGDFPVKELLQASLGSKVMTVGVRRTFRYHQPELASISVATEEVMPELRVHETARVSVGDERMLLTSRLSVTVLKAGVFSLSMQVPSDFDVESLTGGDVGHWDEEDGPNDVRTVIVHFSRRITDATELNLVIARAEKGVESEFRVPRVTVLEAGKHMGRLEVTAERGIRLMVSGQRGVDILKEGELQNAKPGALVFNLLRPSWAVTLRAEVMAPVVKPEVLQWVDLTEGMLQCRAFVSYRIENAGVKQFFIQAPQPGVNLTVSGPHIARVHEEDAERGLWVIDLHRKVENGLRFTVAYQVPYETASKEVTILPLKTVGTEPQRGHVVLTCAGRVQVEPMGDPAGLKAEDPRNIPSTYGAGDLSDAILCYRAVRSEYTLQLSVVRHQSAQVLSAEIQHVRIKSILSPDWQTLNKVTIKLRVGNLRFLKALLPETADGLWSVLVNGRVVSVSRDGDLYCVPLEAEDGGHLSSVEMIYSGQESGGGLFGRMAYTAPSFQGLPLRDIEWEVYARPDYRLFGFGGTMELRREKSAMENARFGTEHYAAWNRQMREETLERAKDTLNAGEAWQRSGQQQKAKQALKEAVNYSQGQSDLNEDARVQFENLIKEQVKIGLVNRRGALRVSNNIISADQQAQPQQPAAFDGNYAPEYVQSMESQLSEKDKQALEVVARKMVEQQAAAAGMLAGIHVTMPQEGRKLVFHRALQIDPMGPVTIVFRGCSVQWMNSVVWGGGAVILFGCFWFAAQRFKTRRVTVAA